QLVDEAIIVARIVARIDACEPVPVLDKDLLKTFQSCEGAAIIRAHRAGVLGCLRCSFFITPHRLNPPSHRPSPGHAHPPLSPLSHGDFRAAEKCKFLCYQEKWSYWGARTIRAT